MTTELRTVTKLEAAKQQLHTAISLWFADADPVSVHTLACAAYQIIHDINRHKKGKELLLDSTVIREEFRSEYYHGMRKAMRFFKHADKDPDPDGTVEFAAAVTDLFILFSIIGLERLGERHSEKTAAFEMFYAIKNPHLVAKELCDRYKIEVVSNVPLVSKSEFLKQFLLARESKSCASQSATPVELEPR